MVIHGKRYVEDCGKWHPFIFLKKKKTVYTNKKSIKYSSVMEQLEFFIQIIKNGNLKNEQFGL